MPLEYSNQEYFPSAKVRLAIRLEEFGATSKNKPPQIPTKNLNGVKVDRDALRIEQIPGSNVFTLERPTSPTPGAGQSQKQSSDNLTFDIGAVIPKQASWKQNWIRMADTLSVTLKWTDLPIDPRVIRSCAIEFFLGVVTARDYAAGIAGAKRQGRGIFGVPPSDNGEPLNVVPDEWVDDNSLVRDNKRFQGWVDKWNVTIGEGEPFVKLECRDNTQLLLDQPAPARLVIGAGRAINPRVADSIPIDEAIANYLSNFPQFAGLSVEYRPVDIRDDKVPPRLAGALSGVAFRPNLGPPPSKGGGGSEQLKVWDYLTDVVGALGHTIRVDGTKIIIQTATGLMDGRARPRDDDPYRTRSRPSRDYPNRTFIYGRNVLEMAIDREYSRKAPKNIEVRSWDMANKILRAARHPKNPKDRITTAHPGDDKTDQNWTIIRVPNVTDQATLETIAQNVYNIQGRNEMSVKIKTKNLASFGGGNEDPDLLDMKPGDTLEVYVNRDPEFSTVTDTERQLTAQPLGESLLEKLGFSPEFATAYEKAYTDSGFQKVFVTKEIDATWDAEQGVSLDITAMNYVTVRVDKPEDTATNDATTARK